MRLRANGSRWSGPPSRTCSVGHHRQSRDSYTLATERSALPLALRNDLSVPIRVRLDFDTPPGMTVTDIGEQEVPPGYLPLRVPVEVHVTQRAAVDVTLRTPDGVQLGEPVRLSVHSNAYGKLLFAITLAAALCWPCWSAGGSTTGSAASPTGPTSTGPATARGRADDVSRRRGPRVRNSPTPPSSPAPGAWRWRRWSAGSPVSCASCYWPRSSARRSPAPSRWPISCPT